MNNDLFIAGEPFIGDVPSAVTARYEAIERAAAGFAWLGDEPPTDPRFWSDILMATRRGLRTFTAEPGTRSLLTGFVRLTMGHFYDCGTAEQAIEIVRAVVEHDPNHVHVGTLSSDRLLGLLRRSQSPIEKRLLVHLFPEVLDNTGCDIDVQTSVLGGRYRLDITLTNEEICRIFPGDYRPVRVAVEADGHEFHERTREQATRDKARDRALTADGWRVLRFTGSEIWKEPDRCAREITAIAYGLESTEETP